MSVNKKNQELPSKIFVTLLILSLSFILFNKFSDPMRQRVLASNVTKINNFKTIESLPYTTMLKKILSHSDQMKKQSFSVDLVADNGSSFTTDYTKGLVHTTLYNTQSLTDETEIIGKPDHRYDLYSLPSDGRYLKNRTIICDFSVKKYPCRDLSMSLLGIPGVYFQHELYTEVFGIDINTISSFLNIGNLDPGFWQLMTKDLANPTNFLSSDLDEAASTMLKQRHAYSALQKSALGTVACVGYAEAELLKLKDENLLKGWCWKDGVYLWGTSGGTNKDRVAKIKTLQKFPLPRDILLEPVLKVVTPTMMEEIQAKGIASIEYLNALKKLPIFEVYLPKL